MFLKRPPTERLIFFAILLITLRNPTAAAEPSTDVDGKLSEFLVQVNQRLAELYNKEVLASWENEIRGRNDLIALLQSEIATKEIILYIQSISSRVAKFKRLNVVDESLKRQLAQIPEIGYEALGRDDLELMYAVMESMSDTYHKAKLCSFTDSKRCNLTLVPDVQNILNTSKNVDEIEYYWLEWRRKTGVAARDDFIKFVELYRKTAKLNDFSNPSDFWFKDLEENSAEASVLLEKLMNNLQPLFQQFHAHVRSSLRKLYGPELVTFAKPYPQNLAEIFIGNAYRQADYGLIDLPYPVIGLPNITAGLLLRGQTNPQRVFWNVAEYFRSLGMPQVESEFWTHNARPKADFDENDDTCWHKAWKYYGLDRVNFSYCPNVNEEQRFFNMFEALSDVYYYRAYQSQPTLFAEEPFPNFSDGLGKVFSLAASSPKYLEKLKVIQPGYTSKKARVNRLYVQGLGTIFLLPVFYVLDRYRIEVLDGKIDISNNCAYWQLTEKYMGQSPPVTRTNDDFDAPAKLLMEVDDQYTSQIMSIVLQFQIYKHFCELTGQYKQGDDELPLDLCDLSNQREIGPIVMQAMSTGSSQSYKHVLQLLTNDTELKLDGFLEYFKPLFEWLVAQNRVENVEVGWEKSNRCTA